MARIAVIILNWNGKKLMQDFLPSVVKYTDPAIGRVVVADNASSDGSVEWLAERFPVVEVIRFEENYGFAGGYNRAIDQVDEEIVLLLNSDVEVTERWLEPLLEILDGDPKIAAVQPKIKSWKEKEKFEYAGACGGYIDKWGFPFCRGRILDVTEEDRGQYDSLAEIFWCSGAAMCIRREVYRNRRIGRAFFCPYGRNRLVLAHPECRLVAESKSTVCCLSFRGRLFAYESPQKTVFKLPE